MTHHLVDRLNDNEGAVMAILTAIYVIATLVLVLLSRQQARTNDKMLAFYGKVEHDRYRPYVIFDIEYDDMIAHVTVRNTGVSPALDVKISVNPELRWDKASNPIAFVHHGIAFLAPNREISEPLGALQTLTPNYPEFKFSGEVAYRDTAGNAFREAFLIDLTYIKTAATLGKHTEEERLADIAKRIDQLGDVLSKPLLIRYISEPEFQRQEQLRREEKERRNAALMAAIAAQNAGLMKQSAPIVSEGTFSL